MKDTKLFDSVELAKSVIYAVHEIKTQSYNFHMEICVSTYEGKSLEMCS
jgi:hypothetical protein